MNNNFKNEDFPGFDYPVSKLSKYIRAGDVFTIMLKDGYIINVSATNEFLSTKINQDLFEQWLLEYAVTNIKDRIA